MKNKRDASSAAILKSSTRVTIFCLCVYRNTLNVITDHDDKNINKRLQFI